MKTLKTTWHGYLAGCLLLLLGASARAVNPCTEPANPITTNCVQTGSFVNPGFLDRTNFGVCVAQTIVPPTAYGTIVSNGFYRIVTNFTCPDDLYLNGSNTYAAVYTFKRLYFVPPIPTSYSTPGTNVYTAYLEYT